MIRKIIALLILIVSTQAACAHPPPRHHWHRPPPPPIPRPVVYHRYDPRPVYVTTPQYYTYPTGNGSYCYYGYGETVVQYPSYYYYSVPAISVTIAP